jgi:hypothetical protein
MAVSRYHGYAPTQPKRSAALLGRIFDETDETGSGCSTGLPRPTTPQAPGGTVEICLRVGPTVESCVRST